MLGNAFHTGQSDQPPNHAPPRAEPQGSRRESAPSALSANRAYFVVKARRQSTLYGV
jgi:hypothetical protein